MAKQKKEYTITEHNEDGTDYITTYYVLAEAKRWVAYYKRIGRRFTKNF